MKENCVLDFEIIVQSPSSTVGPEESCLYDGFYQVHFLVGVTIIHMKNYYIQ